MELLQFYVNFFVVLFALIDPIGNVPIFAAATHSQSNHSRRWLSVYISLFTAAILILFFFTGLSILRFFGISMDAFRIAGGILLFLLGLDMTRGDFLAMFQEAEEIKEEVAKEGAKPLGARDRAKKSFERLVVPFAFPLLIGPGAISTVVIQAQEAQKVAARMDISNVLSMAVGVGAIVSASLAILVSLLMTSTISKLFGRIGMVIVVRVLGLILCAMAVQIIISSVSEITRGIILPSAAHPYVTHHR